jgi:uncharacterized protein (DUF952 family)
VRAWLSLSVRVRGVVSQCDASAGRRATRVRGTIGRAAAPYRRGVQALFHISLSSDWARAQRDGAITDSTRGIGLEQEGYIHCSFAEQVAATARRFYGDLDAIVLLRIDPDLVGSPVVVEDLVGSGEPFPHVYGPIPVTAVIAAITVSPDQTGF